MRAAHHARAARRRHRIARACAITPAGALLADPWARRVQEARADALKRRLARAHPVLATALEDPDLWKELGIEPTRSWVEVLGDAIHARLIRELVFCGFRPPVARAEAGERVFHREYQARFVEDLCRCGYSREAIYRGQAPHMPCHGAEVLPALANENTVRTRVVYTPQGTSRRVPAEDDRRCQCGRSAAEILETVRTARRQMADLNRYTCHGVQATPRTVSTRATRAFYTPQGSSAVPIEPWSRYDTDGTRYAIPPNDLDPTLAESAFAQIPVRMAEAAARGLEDHVARILLEDGTE